MKEYVTSFKRNLKNFSRLPQLGGEGLPFTERTSAGPGR
jgi:hypothetical protein